MCGIIGGFGVKTENIPRAMAAINHRGPDGSGIEYFKSGFIGHTRLAIVDTNCGKQPIWNETKTICVAVNGEFYDHKHWREKLTGHQFSTQSDSELLIHLYEEYGIEVLKHLNGEFAFILYDIPKDRWFLARDRFGIKPLFFKCTTKSLVAGSKASAVAAMYGERLKISNKSIAFACSNQYLPLNASWYEGINRLQAGHYLLNTNGNAKIIKYWDYPKESAIKTVSNSEAISVFENAVKKRIPTEVKAATHLSGGLDSSIISALACRHGVSQAYTVGFVGKNTYNETQEAKETASKLGMNINIVQVSQDDIYQNWEKAAVLAEATFINGHGVAKFLLSKRIQEDGIKVVLTGEGADEVFYGYAHLVQDYFKTPYSEHSIAGIHVPKHSNGTQPSWLQAKVELGAPLRNIFGLVTQNAKIAGNSVEASANSWINYGLGGYILQVLDDGMGMSHAVESRLPFLDVELVEWAKRSIQLKRHFCVGQEKPWLRQLFAEILPANVVQRKKHPFMAPPLNSLLAGRNSKKILDQIMSNRLPGQDMERTKKWLNLLIAKAKIGEIIPADEPPFSTLLSLSYLQQNT